ncbi:phage protein Gp36 family protein [Akkermansia muciniphila]|uniref:phage protein Gp36 family protein n=1 Tax=Akkermansia muciniphila TaxID=239935 RepID=UPI003F8F3D1E
MNHWITLTADMPLEVIDQAELDAITAADTDGSVVDGIIQDVTASVREAIAANPANVMDLTRDTIPRTLRPEALDMIAWRLLKRFAVAVSESRDKAATSARERLEAVRAGTHRVIGPDGRMPVPPGKRPYVQGPRPAYGSGAPGLFPSPRRRR